VHMRRGLPAARIQSSPPAPKNHRMGAGVKRCFVFSVVLIGCVGASAREAKMDSKPPFTIRLEAPAAGTLKATLRIVSSNKQLLLHDSDLQPSELQLRSAKGGLLRALDERSRRKFEIV